MTDTVVSKELERRAWLRRWIDDGEKGPGPDRKRFDHGMSAAIDERHRL